MTELYAKCERKENKSKEKKIFSVFRESCRRTISTVGAIAEIVASIWGQK